MASSSTSSVYIQVIEDVITKIRQEFISNSGPGEGVLTELQGLWELKMMQAGAILGPIDRSSAPKFPANTVRDLNVPYEGPEVYETPTAELLFPPTPLQTPIQTPMPAQTPLPGRMDNPYNIPTVGTPITPNNYPHVDENEASGRPSQYMEPPSSWLNQRPRLDVNVVYDVEGGDRGTTHQPMTQDFLRLASGKRKREDFPSQYRPGGYIPQQDGSGDVGGEIEIYNYQGVVNEDYNVANTPPAPPELQVPTPGLVNQNDDEDEPLNEDDDDDDDLDDGDDDDKELNTQDLVLAQFDKVTRAKNRWKCTLKDGIMHLNNRDILFNKASGEFEF